MFGTKDRRNVMETSSSREEAQQRRERTRTILGIERQEDRVVLSRMGGLPGGGGMGMQGGYGGGFGGQAADVSSFATSEFQGGMMGRGGASGGMMMGRGQFGPMRGSGAMQPGESTEAPVLPASAQVMASLTDSGILGGIGGPVGGPIGHDSEAPTSDDPAIQTLLDNLKTATDTLKADSEAIAANSGLTVASLNSLHRAIADLDAEGVTLDKTATDTAVSSLVRAVAGQTDTTEAAAAFTALFADSGVSQEKIDSAISAITKVVSESNLTVENLDTLQADKAAVESAFQALNDSGYEPEKLEAQSGVAFPGDGGMRGRRGGPNRNQSTESSTDDSTETTTSTTADSSTDTKESTGTARTRRGPGAGFGRSGRFSIRGAGNRRAAATRF